MPLEKQTKIQELQSHCRGSVGMIGDGVNDSIALSQSDIGLAIGKGTKLAIEAADMVLVTGNLLDAVTAIDLARTVFGKIRLNFFGHYVIMVSQSPSLLVSFFLGHTC